MILVIDIVDSIMSKALFRQFNEFFIKMETKYPDFLLHKKVRWHSKGKVVKCFTLCLNGISIFLNEESFNNHELEDY